MSVTYHPSSSCAHPVFDEKRAAWKEYVSIRDSINSSANVRDFHQLLGEHALHLLNTAVHYGNRRQLQLLDDAERLTDLHQEWADKVTTRADPREWKTAAKMAVRHHSHCATGLIGAAAEGSREAFHRQSMLNEATRIAADFHANLDPSATVVQNGDLHMAWARYGQFISATVAALMMHGSDSAIFYRRAGNCMKMAQSLGTTLDQLRLK